MTNSNLIILVVTVISALSGVILGWTGRSKVVRTEIKKEATEQATMIADISYIKQSIEKMVLVLDKQDEHIDKMECRLIKVESEHCSLELRVKRLEDAAKPPT